MPNVMGREFPYTPQGVAEAEQYRQAVGMRGGGMMGFRPVGYQTGGVIDRDDSFAEGEAFDQATREAIIENIMELTGMKDPSSLFDLSDEQLMAAQQNLMAASAAANAPPPAYPPGVREMLGQGVGDSRPSDQDARAMQRLGQEFGDLRISNYDARAMQRLGQGVGDSRTSDQDIRAMQRLGQEFDFETIAPFQKIYDYETQLLRERSAPYMMAEDERAAGTSAQQVQQMREIRKIMEQMDNQRAFEEAAQYAPMQGMTEDMPVGMKRGGIMSLRGY